VQFGVLIYLLSAIGLTPDGSSRVLIYTQTKPRTTKLTTLVGRLPGIRTQVFELKLTKEKPRNNYCLIGRIAGRAHLCYLYPGIRLTTEEKSRKTSNEGS